MAKSEIEGHEYVNLPLTGKLITAVDGSELEKGDFQILKNMRYGKVTPRSISGMTKVNTSIINATYLKPRQGFHFSKAFPSESHVLTQAWNTGLTASKVYQNTTAIPNQGAFSATEVWDESSATAPTGRFSNAPDGCVVYCNGTNSCVWGGAEYRVGAFLLGDSDASEDMKFDYTERINNTLQDNLNIATLTTTTSGAAIDANTKALYHMDGADAGTTFTDSSGNSHTLTAAGNAQTSTARFKFGTASALFDGTGDYLNIADHADFNLSGGTWSIDFWVYIDISASTGETIYFQETNLNNYFKISLTKSLRFGINLYLYESGSAKIDISGGNSLQVNRWHHIEVTENGDDWYIFYNGSLKKTSTDTDRPLNYTQNVYIGCSAISATPGNYFTGNIDEFQISNVARHTSNFTVNSVPYSATNNAYVYIASTRPIQGVKFYIKTANTSAATCEAFYWANSIWNAVSSQVDNTSVGGKTLAQTGTITFTSTVTTAKPKVINKIFAYWYLFSFLSIDTTTQVYYCTIDAPFQQITDIWDGWARPIMAFYVSKDTTTDETTQVLYENYYSADTLSYSTIGGITSSQYVIVGFSERTTGFEVILAPTKVNSATATMTVYYWDGDAWTECSGVVDGTATGTDSVSRSGTVTWDSIDEELEFKTTVSTSQLWYFYKIVWDATLSADVYIDQITGIPAPKTIKGYSYPVMWQDRVWLLDEYSAHRNSARCSATGTVCVFNGWDSGVLGFGGDEQLMAGAALFTRYGSSVYDNLVVFKKNETWIVNGTYPYDYIKWRVSSDYGCVAPGTLASCDLGYEIAQGLTKHILIWQAEDSICAFDGNAVIPISDDIKNYFDKNKSECITSTMVSKSEGFYDPSVYEYHWLFASGTGSTSLNKEFVYDLLKKKWYEVDRGTGKYLQIGFVVKDTSGLKYTYGGIDTGYIERLDYGNTFDGTNITSQFRTGDIPFGGWNFETTIRHVRLIIVAKSTTTSTVTITHYGDGILTSTETTTSRFGVKSTTHRFLKPTEGVNWGSYIFHSLSCSLTTSNESVGFEPIGFAIIWGVKRESIL